MFIFKFHLDITCSQQKHKPTAINTSHLMRPVQSFMVQCVFRNADQSFNNTTNTFTSFHFNKGKLDSKENHS